MRPMKRCAECGEEYDAAAFFGRNHARYAYLASGTRAICIGCEQTARDQRKARSRWPVKIHDVIRRHAARLHIPRAALERNYGWNFDRLLQDAQRAYTNACGYCRRPFETMGHGLSDLTLDLVNPADPPYYTTNVRWVCATCNREKCRTPADLWGAKLAAWEVWKHRRPRPPAPVQGKLF